jgi:hypothetical protein
LRWKYIGAECSVGAGLPEEIDVDVAGVLLGARQQVLGRRLGEAQHDVGGLHLRALAGDELHLQRGVVVGEHGAGLEGAVFFEQDMHRGDGREVGRPEL